MNPAGSKRGAASQAEAEKTKKLDDKPTPTSPQMGFMSGLFARNKPGQKDIPQGARVNLDSTQTSAAVGDVTLLPVDQTENRPQVVRRPWQVDPVYLVKNSGAMREEIDIQFDTLNGKPFRGTITPSEAKHGIYKEALGFEDFTNFDGVRFGFKGVPVVTFKLKVAMNIDELLCVQFFEFKRSGMRLGKPFEDVIQCKIRGLRSKPMTRDTLEEEEPNIDDGTRIVKIEGCDYRIPKEEIMAWLELYGEIKSEMSEDCFNDEFQSDALEGTNRTGVYSIKMKLDTAIPQLLPMSGRRIKMYHRGIQKLCTNCFGNHSKRVCQSQKVLWVDYVRRFVELNPEIPPEYFGKWIDILKNEEEKVSSKNRQIGMFGVEKTGEIPMSNSSRPAKPDIEPSVTGVVVAHESNTQQVDQGNVDAEPEEIESQPPTMKEYDIPENDAEYESMMELLTGCGMKQSEVQQAIKSRETAYNRACREFRKESFQTQGGPKRVTRKGRKNSLDK